MLQLILNIVFVLVAISMIALILMQRGAGAQAGSGFGGGASATVFGARGASSFLTKSTKWLAVVFFALIMLAMEAGATGYAMAGRAWLYVATRIAHTLIHIGSNPLPLRGAIYGVGLLALFCMWLGILLTIL